MITFLSSAKSFLGVNKTNQVRAIKSWLSIHPEAEVIIYGEAEGARSISKELGFTYKPDITCSPSGLPYFNAIVSHAAEHGQHDVQVYLNCDILLPNDILNAIHKIPFKKYLVVGQRINLADGVCFNAKSPDWILQLKSILLQGKAELHYPGGMDYFVFRRGLWENLKSVIIGRAGYDNALIAHCLRNQIPILDGTLSIAALHQYHNYNHIEGGEREVYSGPDAYHNYVLHDVKCSAPNIADADFIIEKGSLGRNYRRDSLRRLELYIRYNLKIGPFWMVLRTIWRLFDAAGLNYSDEIDIDKLIDSYSMDLLDNSKSTG